MQTNVELKAHYADLEHARQICILLGASHNGTGQQVDTFFKVSKGILKLRECKLTSNSLVFYERQIQYGPKQSDCFWIPIEGELSLVRAFLDRALGEVVQVRKTRNLFILGNTRIHLDDVESLGTFIEFEYVVGQGYPREDGAGQLDSLRRSFSIQEGDLVDVSYSDLLLRAKTNSKP